ncbi:MAG: AAA family ATPase, partial [Bacteroidales bacterium]|nr:AAA family ATPase [Bacteroidales bacterium]
MKKLPIGIQSFRNLRNEDYLYVDKTEDVLRMIDSGRVYILSRPRRFGKSLLVSTLDELFSGNRPLFEGLYIHDRWDWTQPYPVIRLDWGNVNHATSEEMEYDMADALDEMARDRQITLNRRYAAGKFGELIRQLYRQTGRQVVVLVDEYDMPILDALDKSPEEIKKIRDFLNTFYKVLKSSDDCLRFIFLTGISKFSGVSIFSALNNPRDITMDGRYASICGYTQE